MCISCELGRASWHEASSVFGCDVFTELKAKRKECVVVAWCTSYNAQETDRLHMHCIVRQYCVLERVEWNVLLVELEVVTQVVLMRCPFDSCRCFCCLFPSLALLGMYCCIIVHRICNEHALLMLVCSGHSIKLNWTLSPCIWKSLDAKTDGCQQ